jgi:hypothetical protein
VAGSCGAASEAGGPQIDGISDQSLPAWSGSFAASPLAAQLRDRAAGPFAHVTMARYVVQWNAMSEPAAGPAPVARANPGGDYRERFEAWLADVGEAGLTPVLALTDYDGSHPGAGEYRAALQALLARASALGEPIAYVEPWNEPNNQGHEPAAAAAAMADTANAVCEALRSCTVVAGDFEDDAGVLAYERSYAAALTFTPAVWGVHPYAALAERSDARLLALRGQLARSGHSAAGTRPQLWFTEIAAFACRAGRVQGRAAQLAEAQYLRSRLLPAVDPAHTFYYGVMFADRSAAPCSGPGGADPELYEADEAPRPAAAVVLGGNARGALALAAFGPAPG